MPINDESGNLLGAKALGDITYEYDWFSGSQINIMIGDVVIDSAVGIGFNVNQSKTPVWGYANQYYSFLAPGKVIVQGALTIAFKESGYLLWPIERFMEKDFNEESSSPRVTAVGEFFPLDSSTKGNTLAANSKAAANKVLKQRSIETLAQNEHSNNAGATRATNQFHRDLGAVNDNEFEKWAEAFEDVIWYGADKNNPYTRDMLFSKNLRDNRKMEDEDVFQHRRADQYPSIDIYIVYGDMSRQQPNHTVKQLLDVSFTGQAQTIEISGQPTFEQYEFIARNIV